MPPNWKQLHETFCQQFWAEKDAKTAEAKEWGFPGSPEEFEKSSQDELLLPEEVFRFSEAVRQPWCKHTTVRELVKFLKAASYPERFCDLKLITEAGYKKALERQQKARREAHKKRQRDMRKKKKDSAKQTLNLDHEMAASSLPEPIGRQFTRRANTVK